MRKDSVRPAKSQSLQELERLGRQLGQPEAGLLEAIAETLEVGEIVDLSSVPKFVEEAAEMCVAAHARWRDCSAEQKLFLRGCSLDLIGLIADQCLRLARSYDEYKQCEADVASAAEQLGAAVERGQVLVEQARELVQSVAGVAQAAPVSSDDAAGSLAATIGNLRDTARELLDRGSSAVRVRANLYALDEQYVQVLSTAVLELGYLSDKASDAAQVLRRRQLVEKTFGMAAALLEQIARAFERANQLDGNIQTIRSTPAQDSGRRPGLEQRSPRAAQVKPTPIKQTVEAPKRVERLMIGGDPRLKR